MVMQELRARIRCLLGQWAGASEDVRAVLRRLDEGDGVGCDRDSEEEREEVSRRLAYGQTREE